MEQEIQVNEDRVSVSVGIESQNSLSHPLDSDLEGYPNLEGCTNLEGYPNLEGLKIFSVI